MHLDDSRITIQVALLVQIQEHRPPPRLNLQQGLPRLRLQLLRPRATQAPIRSQESQAAQYALQVLTLQWLVKLHAASVQLDEPILIRVRPLLEHVSYVRMASSHQAQVCILRSESSSTHYASSGEAREAISKNEALSPYVLYWQV